MSVPLVQVDAFTDTPFAGNPAAVCLLPGAADPRWMQNVAREMNLSETAFLHPEGPAHRLRWFTPAVEVDLCGHATVASAHVLWETGRAPRGGRIEFLTRSGLLSAEQRGAWIELDFPAKPVAPAEAPGDLLAALGVDARFVGRNQFDYLVEVDAEKTVRGLGPTRGGWPPCRSAGSSSPAGRTIPPGTSCRASSPRARGSTRIPSRGRRTVRWGRSGAAPRQAELVGYQASARGGVVRVRVAGDRVHLGGQAVTVLRGELVC